MKRYPNEVKDFIASNVKGIRVKKLIEKVNKQFGTEFTENKMKAFMKNHGLKNEMPSGHIKGEITGIYPLRVKEFINIHYVGTGHQAMADLLNNTFQTNYTKDQMKSYYARFKLDSGLRGQYAKGHVPANKGTHEGGWEPTQFKKGSIPPNRLPIGSERVDSKDGYIYVKIQDGHLNKNWKPKHVSIWEEHNGPIPKGYALVFGDGDKLNFNLDNLILVSRKQLLMLNKNNLIQGDADLTRTAVVIVDIKAKISDRRRCV